MRKIIEWKSLFETYLVDYLSEKLNFDSVTVSMKTELKQSIAALLFETHKEYSLSRQGSYLFYLEICPISSYHICQLFDIFNWIPKLWLKIQKYFGIKNLKNMNGKMKTNCFERFLSCFFVFRVFSLATNSKANKGSFLSVILNSKI